MTNFSTNQVMQFYVLDGSYEIKKPLVGDYFKIAFTHEDGEIATSDKIENVMYGKLTKAAALAQNYKEVTLTFDAEINEGAPIVGQDYIVKVSYPEIGGVGNYAWTVKIASYHVSKEVDANEVYTALAADFNDAFEADGVLKASVDGGLVITQTDNFVKAYKRGLRPVTVVDFNVTASMVTLDGEEVSWDSVVEGKSSLSVPGYYKVADMEYFAMGERGDQYRNADCFNAIDTKYRVNTGTDYDVLTVHYAYKGYNQNSHKSEKDIVIVAPVGKAGKLEELAKAISNAAGVQFTLVDPEGSAKESILSSTKA